MITIRTFVRITDNLVVFLPQYPFLIITSCLSVFINRGKKGTTHLINMSMKYLITHHIFFECNADIFPLI